MLYAAERLPVTTESFCNGPNAQLVILLPRLCRGLLVKVAVSLSTTERYGCRHCYAPTQKADHYCPGHRVVNLANSCVMVVVWEHSATSQRAKN